MPPKKKESKLSLSETLAELKKQDVRIGFDVFDAEPEFLSAGNMVIDSLASGEGIPKGKITTLEGPYASGKTTTALHVAADLLQQGRYVALFDFERAFDKTYARQLGIDPESLNFLYFTPRSFEEGANTFRALLKTGELALGIFDSVAAMIPEEELNAETGKVSVGARAKLMHQFLRQIKDASSDYGTTVIFINQLMEKVDITFIGQQMAAKGIKRYTAPGGTGLPFYSSLIMRYEKIEDIKEKRFSPVLNEETEIKIGSKHRVTVHKNKTGKPGGTADVINIMGQGFSQIHTAIDILIKYDAIKKSGAWFTAKNETLKHVMGDKQYHGLPNLTDAIIASPLIRGTVITVARELLKSAIAEAEFNASEFEYDPADLPEELANQTGIFSG